MTSKKTPRMLELENGQQEMQEKIAQMTKMVTNLTKGDYWWSRKAYILERWHWSIHWVKFERPLWTRKVKEKFVWTIKTHWHATRCSLLDNKLKEIKGVDDLGSVDPRELSLVIDLVIPPKFKMPKFEKYDGTKCPENHLTTYCNKMAGHKGTPMMKVYWSMCSMIVWQGQ